MHNGHRGHHPSTSNHDRSMALIPATHTAHVISKIGVLRGSILRRWAHHSNRRLQVWVDLHLFLLLFLLLEAAQTEPDYQAAGEAEAEAHHERDYQSECVIFVAITHTVSVIVAMIAGALVMELADVSIAPTLVSVSASASVIA